MLNVSLLKSFDPLYCPYLALASAEYALLHYRQSRKWQPDFTLSKSPPIQKSTHWLPVHLSIACKIIFPISFMDSSPPLFITRSSSSPIFPVTIFLMPSVQLHSRGGRQGYSSSASVCNCPHQRCQLPPPQLKTSFK